MTELPFREAAFRSPLPSDRKVGFLFAFVALVVAGYSFYRDRPTFVVVALIGVALLLFVVALAAPGLLRPLNRAWFILGLVLGMVVRPIVMAGLFFGLFSPIALAMRAFGRDPLRLRPRKSGSYWIDRPASAITLEDQF